MKNRSISIVVFLLIFAGGCRVIQPVESPHGHYYINPAADFSKIGKVAVLELDNPAAAADQTAVLTESLVNTLAQKHLFSVHLINRSDPKWQALDLGQSGDYSYQKLADLQKELRVDAIVLGTICRYNSYPNFLIHLRLKMISLNDGSLIWATEEIWDAADKKVEQRMRAYYSHQLRSGFQPMDWQIMLMSPKAFTRFVFYEVGQTLPEIYTIQNSGLSSENSKNFSQITGNQKNNSIFSLFH